MASKISRFFLDLWGAEKTIIELSQKAEDTGYYALAIEDFAIQVAINLIAGLIAKCKFRTVVNGEEKEGIDFYRWNYEPNINQNGAEFKTELISKMLYYNEALIFEINGQMLIADDFTRTQYALYPNKYSNVRRGDFLSGKNFYERDIMYFGYANKDTKELLSGLLNGYCELIGQSMDKYKRAGGRKGVVKTDINPQKDEAWQKALNDLYGNRFKSYYKNENALVVLPKGIDYTEISASGSQKSTSDVTDIINLTNETFAKVGQCFKLPKALLLGDVANLDSSLDEALTTAIEPIISWLESEIIRKQYGQEAYTKGYYLKIDTTTIKHIDIMDVAGNLNNILSTGLYNLDQLRRKLGELPLNTWWSKQHYMTLNNARAEQIASEGNNDEKSS
jgi:HK97 family phage portal protein